MIQLDLQDMAVIGLIMLFSATVMPRLGAWFCRKHSDFKKACDEFERNFYR